MSPRSARITSTASREPRVLLVDHHRQFLGAVPGMLSDDFAVVGVASDGTQALEIVPQLNPDK